jgi:hypothetical protein
LAAEAGSLRRPGLCLSAAFGVGDNHLAAARRLSASVSVRSEVERCCMHISQAQLLRRIPPRECLVLDILTSAKQHPKPAASVELIQDIVFCLPLRSLLLVESVLPIEPRPRADEIVVGHIRLHRASSTRGDTVQLPLPGGFAAGASSSITARILCGHSSNLARPLFKIWSFPCTSFRYIMLLSWYHGGFTSTKCAVVVMCDVMTKGFTSFCCCCHWHHGDFTSTKVR